MSEETQALEATPEKKKPIGKIVVVVIVVLALFFGVKNWMWSRNHESTDNAQIAGDVVLVAPLVQGTVAEILAKDNAIVKKGQPIVKLDPSKLQASYDQAKANLQAAVADANAAGVSVTYAEATSKANQATSSGMVGEAGADVSVAESASRAAQATIKGSEAAAQAARATVESAQMDRKVAEEAVARAESGIEAARADLEAAKAGVDQAKASLKSAQATHSLMAQQLKRTKDLFDQGAESKTSLDTAEANNSTSEQQVQVAASSVFGAESLVKQRESALKSARSQLEQSKSMVLQAESRIHSARDMADSARANTEVARLQARATSAKIGSALAHKTTAQGQAQGAQALNINVEKLRADQKQALAKVEQAQALLKTAEIDLGHAMIYAPCDGRISKRAIEQGSYVQVGTAMLYVVPSDSIYVLANFKETQVAKMKEGDKVEVEIDGLPGKPIQGEIESLSAATGSTFALLPPDNATGNFVKVVQRVPVKIKINQADVGDKLRVGLSVVVSVETR